MGVARPRLTLVTRRNCHLCEEMEEILDTTLGPLEMTYERLDVDRDADLLLRFSDAVPVLLRDGQPVAKIRVTGNQLSRIVRRSR